MRRFLAEQDWHAWWRRGFATTLILALVIGLFLSFRPAGFDEREVAGVSESPAAPQSPAEEPPEEEPEEAVATEEPEDTGLTKAEAQALIDAARDPEETTVQVLDAGGGSGATGDVAETLRELGYDVVAINSSRQDYPATTVLYTEGNKAEAEALRARDERFTATASNERLSEGVDVHIAVGPDWQ